MPHEALIWKNKFYSIFTIVHVLWVCVLSFYNYAIIFFFLLEEEWAFPININIPFCFYLSNWSISSCLKVGGSFYTINHSLWRYYALVIQKQWNLIPISSLQKASFFDSSFSIMYAWYLELRRYLKEQYLKQYSSLVLYFISYRSSFNNNKKKTTPQKWYIP